MTAIVAWWNRFWFAAVDARTVGLMRLLLGLILLTTHVAMVPDLDVLFGADGPVSVAAVQGSAPWSPLVADLMQAMSQPVALRVTWVVIGVIYLGVVLGVRSRLMVVFALLAQAWLYHRNPFMQHGGDRVLRLATLSLALVPCGAALSWDARRRGPSEAPAMVPILAQRLIQIQLVVIYMHSGWVKSGGSTWRNGTALYYALSNTQYQRFPGVLDSLMQRELVQWLCTVGTWITVVWEASFGLLMLWWPTRVIGLLIGVLVHGGIFTSMMVGSFSFVMVWSYLAFLPVDWPQCLDRWRERRRDADRSLGASG